MTFGLCKIVLKYYEYIIHSIIHYWAYIIKVSWLSTSLKLLSKIQGGGDWAQLLQGSLRAALPCSQEQCIAAWVLLGAGLLAIHWPPKEQETSMHPADSFFRSSLCTWSTCWKEKLKHMILVIFHLCFKLLSYIQRKIVEIPVCWKRTEWWCSCILLCHLVLCIFLCKN